MNDFGAALRNLRNAPGFTFAVVMTLGIGIAVTSAVFSLANWLALRPLPGISDQSRLAMVDFHRGGLGGVSYPDVADLRSRIGAFQDLAAFAGPDPFVVQVPDGRPYYLQGAMVSSGYFPVLGVRMAVGRWFTPQEEAAAPGTLVAVITDRTWRSLFASDPNVVGRSFTVSGLPATVVGVTPPGFHGTELLSEQDLWIPANARWAVAHLPGTPQPPLHNRDAKIFRQMVGRLAPGATMGQARPQLQAALTTIEQAHPKESADWKKAPPTVSPADGVAPAARDYLRRVLGVLLAAGALVLLLACANTVNLLVSRGVARRSDVAVRRALGGSAARLIRTQMAESLVLAAAAAAGGLLLSTWMTALFQSMTLPGGNPWMGGAGIGGLEVDWRVIAFTALVALLSGAVLGLVSGVAGTRGELVEGLKVSWTTAGARRGRLQGALVAFQLAISVALLVNALLLVRTARNLGRIPVGFDATGVTSFGIWPQFSGYDRDHAQGILRQAVAAVRAIPGVEHATLSSYAPFTTMIGDALRRKGTTDADPSAPAVVAWIGPGYFETMGIRLLAGRGFTEDEVFLPLQPGVDQPAIVSASQARRLFGNVDVVGGLVRSANPSLTYRIIGVAPDTRWEGLLPGADRTPFYQPLASMISGGVILVRSRLPLSELRPAVERGVATVAPSVPLFDEERLSDKIARSVSEQLLLARTLPALTLIAMLLAGVGLYAVVAFSVAQRIRELGIRIALGARGGQIIAMVLRRGAALGMLGLLVGLGGAATLGRVVASRLYGVSPADATSYLVAAGLLLALVALASAVPARRAARADPMEVLRSE